MIKAPQELQFTIFKNAATIATAIQLPTFSPRKRIIQESGFRQFRFIEITDPNAHTANQQLTLLTGRNRSELLIDKMHLYSANRLSDGNRSCGVFTVTGDVVCAGKSGCLRGAVAVGQSGFREQLECLADMMDRKDLTSSQNMTYSRKNLGLMINDMVEDTAREPKAVYLLTADHLAECLGIKISVP